MFILSKEEISFYFIGDLENFYYIMEKIDFFDYYLEKCC